MTKLFPGFAWASALTNAPELHTETTPEGEQIFAAGVKPITLRNGLAVRAAQPMAPRHNPNAAQKPCDVGLFDEVARNQLDMLDFLSGAIGDASTPEAPKED